MASVRGERDVTDRPCCKVIVIVAVDGGGVVVVVAVVVFVVVVVIVCCHCLLAGLICHAHKKPAKAILV